MKQNSKLYWFKKRDTNSKLFHSWIRGRRRRLFIHIIHDKEEPIHGDKKIGKASYEYFVEFFIVEIKSINEKNLECISRMVNQEKNNRLTSQPTTDELQEVLFSMNLNSPAGRDCINGYFFYKCWEIINKDLMEVYIDFLSCQDILKYFYHSSIVLTSKVNNPNKLKDFRPISLIHFINKIISILSSTRLIPTIPNFITRNNSIFVNVEV